ncbi:MAG: hypothetical protein AAFO76_10095, partial [Cyanobacteria bacterium J06607_15]
NIRASLIKIACRYLTEINIVGASFFLGIATVSLINFFLSNLRFKKREFVDLIVVETPRN